MLLTLSCFNSAFFVNLPNLFVKNHIFEATNIETETRRLYFMERIANNYAYWVIALVFGIGLILNMCFQDRIEVADGKGIDGVYYYKVAEQFSNHQTIETKAPFVYRLGTPFLASLLPFSLLENFQIVNLLATLMGCFLLFYWLSLFIKSRSTALLLTVVLMTHWTFYIRYVQYYPATCDPFAFVFVLLLLIQLYKFRNSKSFKHGILFSLLLCVGVLFREFLIVFSFGVLFLEQPFDKKQLFWIDFNKLLKGSTWFAISFIAALIGIAFTHWIATASGSNYGFLTALLTWIDEKSIFEYINGMFNTFGPAIVLLFVFWKTSYSFFAKNHEHLVLAIIFLLICWFTGGDTERFFMWFSPLFLVPLGLIIEKNLKLLNHKQIWIPIGLATLFIFRVFWPIPQIFVGDESYQFPIFQAFQKDLVNMLSFHGQHKVTYVVLLEHILISGSVVFTCRYLLLKKKATE